MFYIDLILSFILFVWGILTLLLKSFRPNPWLAALSVLFFPVAVIGYYVPDLNLTLFGTIGLVDVLLFPAVKILLILSLLRVFRGERR
jgi:hypothetical protein